MSIDQTQQLTTDDGPRTGFRQRVRIRFTKEDDLRWLGHRDLMRLWERLFRRAAVPLSMTEGFHPKPRINFPSALAVGIAGLDELLEVDLAEPLSADSLRSTVVPQTPPGMNIKAIEVLPAPDHKAQVKFVTFEVQVPADRQPALAQRMAWLLAQSTFPIQREGRKTALELRPLIAELELDHDILRMRLRVESEGSARPREVLQALNIENLEYEGFFLTRTRVEIE